MKPDGETQSYMNSNEIRVGSKEIMTHAQRQAFLKTSRLGKLLGVAHLLPEVEEVKEEISKNLPHVKRMRGLFKPEEQKNQQLYSKDTEVAKHGN